MKKQLVLLVLCALICIALAIPVAIPIGQNGFNRGYSGYAKPGYGGRGTGYGAGQIGRGQHWGHYHNG